MKNIRWLVAILFIGLLVATAFKLGQWTKKEEPDVMFSSLSRVTYDVSQYAPEAFEETNRHFQEAIERGDYAPGISLICVYPSGLGGDTIVVAGSNISDETSKAIFEAVGKSLDRYPRILRVELENILNQEKPKEAEQ